MVVDVLRSEGLVVVDLGANVPTQSLVDAAARIPDLKAVGISVGADSVTRAAAVEHCGREAPASRGCGRGGGAGAPDRVARVGPWGRRLGSGRGRCGHAARCNVSTRERGRVTASLFRVFNPTLQARRFDPDGTYIRRWVPELAGLGAPFVHEPWRSRSGPPEGYAAPIVDHSAERERTLSDYAALRSRSVPGAIRIA